MSDANLEQKVAEYAELAKEDKNIDVTALMLNALENEQQNKLSPKSKRWGYFIAISAPPFGLIFSAWFWLSGKDDGKKAAAVCAILTVVSIGALLILGKLFISTSGTSVQQIEQIKPSDIQQINEP